MDFNTACTWACCYPGRRFSEYAKRGVEIGMDIELVLWELF